MELLRSTIARLRKLVFTAFILFAASIVHAQIKWPVITTTTRPWTRWWWEGSAVNKKDLTWNLEEYKKAGLGGVEITPIYGVIGARLKENSTNGLFDASSWKPLPSGLIGPVTLIPLKND